MTQRIQCQRTKGWRKPEGAVYIGRHGVRPRQEDRGSPFANPFSVADYGRAGAIAAFRAYLERLPAWDLTRRLDALEGQVLMCWCPVQDKDGTPVPCHGDVWLELLAARQNIPTPPDVVAVAGA